MSFNVLIGTGIQGPRGERGQIGPQGDIGPIGPAGQIGPALILKVEYRVLTETEIFEKRMTLQFERYEDSDLTLDLDGGSIGWLGDDFRVTENEILWDELGLDGLISVGDRVRISYAIRR